MNNFIYDKIYNTYFGIKPEPDNYITPKEKYFVYADDKSARIHTNESVSFRCVMDSLEAL